MNTLKAIIFDNEWVIIRNDWSLVSRLASEAYKKSGLESLSGQPLSGKAFKKALQVPYCNNGRDSNALAEYSAGRLEGEKFWDIVLTSFGVETTKENVETMREAMRQLVTEPDPDAINFVRKLKQHGYRVLMLSNSNPEITEGNTSRNGFCYELFHHCYLSHQIGYRKPEPEIWKHVLREEKLQARECLFVDDKEENLDAARDLGIGVMYHKIGQGKLSDKLGFLLKNVS